MSSEPPFYYEVVEDTTSDTLLYEDQLLVNPGADLLEPSLANSLRHLDDDLTPGYSESSQHRPPLSGLSSSYSQSPLGAARRRLSSSVTAFSSRSLESESLPSRGPSGTPESRRSGKNKTPESGWPTLKPQPPRQDPGSSSFSPIQNSWTLPKKRVRRVPPKPKPEPSKEVKEAQRSRDLERNREAASKCREKKKRYADDLEESRSELETQNSTLKLELETLADEAARIKAQLMGHSDCHDPSIEQWLDSETKRCLIGDIDRYSNIMADLGPDPSLPYDISHDHIGTVSDTSGYPQTFHNHAGPSSTGVSRTMHQQDVGFAHSPVMFGDDQDPNFMSEMQASMLADGDFPPDLLQDQYTDYQTDYNYMGIPDASYP